MNFFLLGVYSHLSQQTFIASKFTMLLNLYVDYLTLFKSIIIKVLKVLFYIFFNVYNFLYHNAPYCCSDYANFPNVDQLKRSILFYPSLQQLHSALWAHEGGSNYSKFK